MIVQTFKKGNRTLELHRHEGTFVDDDGDRVISEYWECITSDGKKYPFANVDIACLFIKQNCWEEMEF